MFRTIALLLGIAIWCPASDGMIGWRHDNTGVYPDDCKPVTSWSEDDNVVWKVPLPNCGNGSPIVVGKKVITLCEPGWTSEVPILLCHDADTGELLWRRDIDHFDLLESEEQAEAKALRREYWDIWHKAFTAWWSAYGTGEPNEAVAKAEARAGKISFGTMKWNGAAKKTMGTLAKKYHWIVPCWGYACIGATFATPVSDGRLIYVYTHYDVLTCHDLDGNLKWMRWFKGANGGFGGTASTVTSPLVVDNSIITDAFGVIRRVDAASGETIWETKERFAAYKVGGMQLMELDGTKMIATGRGTILRLADGHTLVKHIGSYEGDGFVTNGKDAIFGEIGRKKRAKSADDPSLFAEAEHYDKTQCIRFAFDGPDTLKPALVWSEGHGKPHIYADQVIFTQKSGAIDSDNGKPVRAVGLPASSQTRVLVDGNIIGTDTVFRDGRWYGQIDIVDAKTGKRIARNLLSADPLEGDKLRQYHSLTATRDKPGQYETKQSQWYTWSWGRSLPFFSGNRIFIRSFDNLYCIGEKGEAFTPSASFTTN